MKLAEWIAKENLKQVEAAPIIGVSNGFLSEVLSGQKRLSPQTAARISMATKGAVSITELLYPDGVPAGATSQ